MNVIIDGVEYEPIRKPLCEVEGKPVYKGDKLWFIGSKHCMARVIYADSMDANYLYVTDGGLIELNLISWNPPKRTVMVELLIEDAERWMQMDYDKSTIIYRNLASSCRKAMDNLK